MRVRVVVLRWMLRWMLCGGTAEREGTVQNAEGRFLDVSLRLELEL